MKIEINQADNGTDTVTINGEAVSSAVSEVILEAIDRVAIIQYHEAEQYDPCAECDGLGCEAMCAANGDVPGSDMAWGPEDGGSCPCGSPSCDGTCDRPKEDRASATWEFSEDENCWMPTSDDVDVKVKSSEDDEIPF